MSFQANCFQYADYNNLADLQLSDLVSIPFHHMLDNVFLSLISPLKNIGGFHPEPLLSVCTSLARSNAPVREQWFLIRFSVRNHTFLKAPSYEE
jgi:hypothetical protein